MIKDVKLVGEGSGWGSCTELRTTFTFSSIIHLFKETMGQF